jgi:mannose-6-phosphate isomerase-like protein (cupin superfamily)
VNHFFDLSALLTQQQNLGKAYLEFLRIPAMSAGIYILPQGGTDPQRPHKEDELYYVVRGRARMRIAEEDRDVTAGTVTFVEANVEHRFHDIEEELVVMVFFAPAESS